MSTDKPDLRSSLAAAIPETPAPMMTTSHEAFAIWPIPQVLLPTRNIQARAARAPGTTMRHAQLSHASDTARSPSHDPEQCDPKSRRAVIRSEPRRPYFGLYPEGRHVAYSRRTG